MASTCCPPFGSCCFLSSRRRAPRCGLFPYTTLFRSLIVIGANFDPSRALILSQVFLSFGIPFAMIPLLIFTRDKKLMGSLVNSRFTNYASYGVAALIIGLNVFLLEQTLFGSR